MSERTACAGLAHRSLRGVALAGLLWVAACSGGDGGGDGAAVDDTIDTADTVGTSDLPVTTDGTGPSARSGPPGSTVAGVQPEGFTTIAAVITDADGEECEVCLWLADSGEERSRGLMGVTDLGAADGMAFVFPEPTSGSFYMFQTPTPLSIAWFGPDGEFVGTADMEPCLDTPAGECPLYSPGAEYDVAVEVFEGDLGDLLIGPGARLELLDGTEADRCPLAP